MNAADALLHAQRIEGDIETTKAEIAALKALIDESRTNLNNGNSSQVDMIKLWQENKNTLEQQVLEQRKVVTALMLGTFLWCTADDNKHCVAQLSPSVYQITCMLHPEVLG